MKKVIICLGFLLIMGGLIFAGDISELVKKGDKACKIGNYMAAKKFYKQAIQLDPKNEDLWKKYDKALKMLYGGGEEEGEGGC